MICFWALDCSLDMFLEVTDILGQGSSYCKCISEKGARFGNKCESFSESSHPSQFASTQLIFLCEAFCSHNFCRTPFWGRLVILFTFVPPTVCVCGHYKGRVFFVEVKVRQGTNFQTKGKRGCSKPTSSCFGLNFTTQDSQEQLQRGWHWSEKGNCSEKWNNRRVDFPTSIQLFE